jgi:hypothetical protein
MVPACRVLRDAEFLDLAAEVTAPPKIKRLRLLCQLHRRALLIAREREGILEVMGDLLEVMSDLPAVLAFDVRILSAALEEVREGAFKVADRLLENDTRPVVEPRMVVLLFELGEAALRLVVADRFALFVIRVGTHLQRPAGDVPGAPERLSKLALLRLRRGAAMAVCSVGLHLFETICSKQTALRLTGSVRSPANSRTHREGVRVSPG